MSLINFPLGISVGFAPQFNSVPSKAPRIADPTQVSLFGSADKGFTKLSTVQIIFNDNDISAENHY